MNYIKGYTNTVTPNTNDYAKIQQMPTMFTANIWIEYPGYKNIRDFVVKFSNNNFTNVPIKYSDIVSELYYLVIANPNLINDYYDFVIDVANNWEHINLYQHPNGFF